MYYSHPTVSFPPWTQTIEKSLMTRTLSALPWSDWGHARLRGLARSTHSKKWEHVLRRSAEMQDWFWDCKTIRETQRVSILRAFNSAPTVITSINLEECTCPRALLYSSTWVKFVKNYQKTRPDKKLKYTR